MAPSPTSVGEMTSGACDVIFGDHLVSNSSFRPYFDASGSDSRYYTTTDSENNDFEYYSRPQSLSPFQDDSYEHSECLNESTTVPENMYHSPYNESQGDDFEDSAYNTIFPENL